MKKSILKKILTVVKVYRNWYLIPFDRYKFKKEVIYITRLGPKFLCRCGDSDSGECAVIFSGLEYPLKFLLPSHMKRDSCIIDLGGNIGAFSIWINHILKNNNIALSNIICVEPDPDNLRILHKNLELNGVDNISVYEGAIGAENGSACIKKFGKSDGIKVIKDNTGIRVNQITVNSLCEEFDVSSIELIKMDIEGSEYAVLEAAYDFVIQNVRRLIVEVHGYGNGPENPLYDKFVTSFEITPIGRNILYFRNKKI